MPDDKDIKAPLAHRLLWAFLRKDKEFHSILAAKYPRTLAFLDKALGGLHSIVSHGAAGVIATILLGALALTGVVDKVVAVSVVLAWFVALIWFSRSQWVKVLTIISRLVVILTAGAILAFAGRAFGNWCLTQYHLQKEREQSQATRAKPPVAADNTETEKPKSSEGSQQKPNTELSTTTNATPKTQPDEPNKKPLKEHTKNPPKQTPLHQSEVPDYWKIAGNRFSEMPTDELCQQADNLGKRIIGSIDDAFSEVRKLDANYQQFLNSHPNASEQEKHSEATYREVNERSALDEPKKDFLLQWRNDVMLIMSALERRAEAGSMPVGSTSPGIYEGARDNLSVLRMIGQNLITASKIVREKQQHNSDAR